MSKLLSKLKTLVQARARGPRRYKTQPASPDEAERLPRPEVTEAPAQQGKLPEVTEASPTEVKIATTQPATASRPAPAVQKLSTDEDQTDALEGERVVDLLKGKQS